MVGRYFRVGDLPERDLVPGVRVREVVEGDEVLAFVTLDRGARVPRHFHRHEQVSYVTAGRVEFTVGSERRILGAGEGVRIPPCVLHEERALEGPASVLHGFHRFVAQAHEQVAPPPLH